LIAVAPRLFRRARPTARCAARALEEALGGYTKALATATAASSRSPAAG
jgi:hypothetical protein